MGFAKLSKLFCDSVIFWGLYNHADDKSKGTAIGKYMAELRDAFSHTDLRVESVKLAHSGKIKMDDLKGYFSEPMLKRHRRLFEGKEYQPGFIAIKVSLNRLLSCKDCCANIGQFVSSFKRELYRTA